MRAIEKTSKKFYEVLNGMTTEDWIAWDKNREANRKKRIQKLLIQQKNFCNEK